MVNHMHHINGCPKDDGCRIGKRRLKVRDRYRRIYKAADGRCHYCDRELKPCEGTEDHVVPLSRGGADNIRNVVLACWPCNNQKADMVEFYHGDHT